MRWQFLMWRVAAALVGSMVSWAQAQALLQCDVTYAGMRRVLQFHPHEDPYQVAATDIGGRFRFKAVVVGQGAEVRRIGLYVDAVAYPQPVLVQQASYLPPFAQAPLSLSGEQHVYAGHLQRELIYQCSLQGAEP